MGGIWERYGGDGGRWGMMYTAGWEGRLQCGMGKDVHVMIRGGRACNCYRLSVRRGAYIERGKPFATSYRGTRDPQPVHVPLRFLPETMSI